jgi:uncharacterized membrane-anchored protein
MKGIMSTFKQSVLLACAALLAGLAPQLRGADIESKLKALQGPAKAKLGNIAEIDVPAGYVFLDGEATRALLRASGEPPSGNELGWIRTTNGDWSVVFEFQDIGYVKDDDKDKLDADKLLASYKAGTARQNKEREKMGKPPITDLAWEVPPRYNSDTHNLEWAIRGMSGGEPLMNYNTRMLGRKGMMEVILITAPESLKGTLPAFKDLMAGFTFTTGNSYAEYRPGDKIAKYGLAALVVGGVAVGAAKLGLFTWLMLFLKKGWKLVIVAFGAVVAFFKKLFAKITGRANESGMRQE